MIAGEKKLVSIEQHRVAARMTWHWNRDEIRIEIDGVFARNDLFDTKSLSAIVSMHDALTVESIGKALMIGDIVFVREKHCAHAAHRFDLFDQWTAEARRVNEHVAAFRFGTHDEITPRAETRFRCEAAEVNILADVCGESVNADARVVLACFAD